MGSTRWMSVDEIPGKLGTKPAAIYAWLANKGPAGHRLGRVWHFDPSEVDTWVRSGAGAEPQSRSKPKLSKKVHDEQSGRKNP